jgi:hypothetical protein
MECENIFADHREAYVKLVPAGCLFKPKLRRLGWSGIILGKGIGLRGFVEKLVSSPAHYG